MKVPGSGRKKGTPNKHTSDLMDKAAEMSVDPFEILLLFATGDNNRLGLQEIPADLRFKAAKEAASYMYPKRKSVDVTQSFSDGISIVIDHDDLLL